MAVVFGKVIIYIYICILFLSAGTCDLCVSDLLSSKFDLGFGEPLFFQAWGINKRNNAKAEWEHVFDWCFPDPCRVRRRADGRIVISSRPSKFHMTRGAPLP